MGKMVEILREIGMIARALDSISNIEFKEVDLIRGQYLYIVRICEHPGITPVELADMIKVDKATTVKALKKLEKIGLITQTVDKKNNRTKKIYPTAKGEEVHPFIARENEYSNRVALDGFTEAEAQQLKDYLERVRINIEDDWYHVEKGNQRIY
ncbi:hypothetical protein IGI49_003973 [Enterococcus sp. AZ071]